jgi:hypothetical protein
MKITATTKTTVFYTVVKKNHERHFLTAWQTIAFLSKINLDAQKN